MHTTPTKRTYRREEEWRDLVDEFEKSSIPAKEFCAKHSIATSGLYTWKKKFESNPNVIDNPFIELRTPTKEISVGCRARTGLRYGVTHTQLNGMLIPESRVSIWLYRYATDMRKSRSLLPVKVARGL